MIKILIDLWEGNQVFARGLCIVAKKDGYYKYFYDTTCGIEERHYISSADYWRLIEYLNYGIIPGQFSSLTWDDISLDKKTGCWKGWHYVK